jgi:hypothetical protein
LKQAATGSTDESEIDEASIIHAASTASRAERQAIKEVLSRLDLTITDSSWKPSKWGASQVDAVAALTLLQRDLFARINPAIVEAYISTGSPPHNCSLPNPPLPGPASVA